MKKIYIDHIEHELAKHLGLSIPEFVRQRDAAKERLKDFMAWMETPEGNAEMYRRTILADEKEKQANRKKVLARIKKTK
jgi:hypothetical protein